jgi:hypothetical protein
VLQLNFPGTRELEVVLEDESHLPGAEAMFAVIYEVPDVINQQDQATLVLMAMLALQHDVPRVSKAVLEKLCSAQLSAEGLQAICELPAWPALMYPLLQKAVKAKLSSQDEGKEAAVQKMLLCVFEDLEEVWTETGSTRRNMLVELSSDALPLLLRSAELKVASEDTILFTIASNNKIGCGYTGDEAFKRLIALLRLPHLTTEALIFIVPKLERGHLFKSTQLLLASYMQHHSLAADFPDIPDHLRHPRRPASSVTSSTFRFFIKVECLEVTGRHVAKWGRTRGPLLMSTQSPDHAFAGRSWALS